MAAKKSLVRHIGIDFGTSTSVLCYKDYPVGAGEDAFGIQTPEIDEQNLRARHLIPTVAFRDGAGRRLFGSRAERLEISHPGNVHRNFKMDLVSADPEKRRQAEQLLDEFFAHLYRRYAETRHHDKDFELASEHTHVSYPVKWPDEVRQRTLEAARKAGFPEVDGLDEPSAAMRYLLLTELESMKKLAGRGVLRDGVPLKVLLLDMGAGTTDLVLYNYTPGSNQQEILATWPPVDEAGTFGGREIDAILTGLLHRTLESRDPAVVGAFLKQNVVPIREWKESFSRVLANEQEDQEKPHFLAQLEYLGGIDARRVPRVTRSWLESELEEYIAALPRLLGRLLISAVERGALQSGEEIDLVILTGGHSQWYFLRDLLTGRRWPGTPDDLQTAIDAHLAAIHRENDRLIVPPIPQEVVARGLALMGKPVKILKRAANSAWLKLQVSISSPEVIEILKIGQKLPYEKGIFQRIQARYKIDESIDLRWTPLFGSSLERALDFDPKEDKLVVQDGVEKLAVWVGKRFLREIDDTADIYLDVTVDEAEHLTAIGLIKGGQGFDDVKFLSINRDRPSTPEQSGLRQRYERERAASRN